MSEVGIAVVAVISANLQGNEIVKLKKFNLKDSVDTELKALNFYRGMMVEIAGDKCSQRRKKAANHRLVS